MAVIKRYAHINQASNDTQNKLDAADAYITGSLHAGATDISSTLTVAGASQLNNTLGVAGKASLADALDVAFASDLHGAVKAYDTFEAVGAATLGSTLDVTGAATLDSTLAVAHAATLSDTLSVAKQASFSDKIVVTLDISGSTNLDIAQQAHIGGIAKLDSALTVSGDSNMKNVAPNSHQTYDLGVKSTAEWRGVYAKTGSFNNLEASTVTAKDHLISEGDLTVANAADLNGSLDVAGTSDLHGDVHMYGNADIDGTLNVDGQTDLQAKLVAHNDVAVQGGLTVGLTAAVAGNFSVNTNKFTVAASSGDTAVAGDLIVSGDLTVMGDRIEAQVTELKIEDGLITLMSGSTSRAMSNDAGVEVEVGGGEMPAIKFANAVGGASGSWVSNLDWIPAVDLTYDLGIPSQRWRELNLSGDANVGGDLSVAGAASVGALDASSLAVAGAATFDAGIAVDGTGSFSGAIDAASAALTGDLSAANGTFSANISAVDATLSGDLAAVNGTFSADISAVSASFDHLAVSGASALHAVSATAIDAASVALTGDLTAVNATLSGDLSAVNGTFSGDLAAVSASLSGDLTVAKDATFNGKATFNGTFAVPGTGSFGALMVGGVNLSPISASCTTNANVQPLFSFSVAEGEIVKLEVEVLAGGAAMNDIAIAGFKYSVICANAPGAGNSTAAIELAKEVLGGSGAKLDVSIDDSTAGTISLKADGSQVGHNVRWSAQVVKKMKMNAGTGAVIEDRA